MDGFDLDTALVDPEQVADAASQVSPDVRRALELAAQRVADFHQSVMPRDFMDEAQGLGQLIRPIDRVGLYAPGGAAAYPSTVLMTAIPARVAGVSEIILTTPRKAGQPLNPAVMAAAQIAGVDSVYQVGGVPAIAAMAYGTESIPKVDKIAAPATSSLPTPSSLFKPSSAPTAYSAPPRPSSSPTTVPIPPIAPPTSSVRLSTTPWLPPS